MDNSFEENKEFESNIDENKDEILESTENDNEQKTETIDEESFFGGGDNTYVKKADKYEDIKSSSVTMLIVGLLGLIFVTLSLTKVINIPFNTTTSWLFYTIMTSVFIIFVVAGIVSFMHAKEVKDEAEIENKIIDEINNWADENINSNIIDSGLDLTQTVEILYFSRFERIKELLMHKFEDVDEGLIDLLTENIYQKMYENQTQQIEE